MWVYTKLMWFSVNHIRRENSNLYNVMKIGQIDTHTLYKRTFNPLYTSFLTPAEKMHSSDTKKIKILSSTSLLVFTTSTLPKTSPML